MCKCGETNTISKDVLKSEGQHRAMCCELKAWPEGAVEGGFCPTGVMLSVSKERGVAQTGNGESALWSPAFSSQAMGSSHPPETHLSAVRGGEREREGWGGTEGCRCHRRQRGVGTHPILQQLLGVVDGADDAGSAAASTAMTATAGLPAQLRRWARCVF